MSYTALKLITKAFYRAGIKAQGFNAPTSDELNDGLDSFNDILSEKTVDNSLNPYYQKFDLNVTPGIEEYFIENLIEAETVTFTLDSVRYSVMKTSRAKYFGSARANNIESLPFMWHLEREFGGARLFLYYLPNQAYDFQIWGQFSLAADVTLLTDLSLTYDRFYISYLKCALAERLCLDYDMAVPEMLSKQLDEFDEIMKSQISSMDLNLQKTSTLQGGSFVNYGVANLAPNGWLPSGNI